MVSKRTGGLDGKGSVYLCWDELQIAVVTAEDRTCQTLGRVGLVLQTNSNFFSKEEMEWSGFVKSEAKVPSILLST